MTCKVSSTLGYPVAPHSSHSITFQHSWHARLHPTANPGNKLIMCHCAIHITKILLSLSLNTCYLNFILILHGKFSCDGYNSIKKWALQLLNRQSIPFCYLYIYLYNHSYLKLNLPSKITSKPQKNFHFLLLFGCCPKADGKGRILAPLHPMEYFKIGFHDVRFSENHHRIVWIGKNRNNHLVPTSPAR